MTKFISLILVLFLFFTQSANADTYFLHRPDVQQFINQMVQKHQFNKAKLTTLFSEVKLRPQVIHHMNKPLEQEPWHLYQTLFVNEWRIKHGVEFWNQYASALKKAENEFGVPASIIVATIGVETKYGKYIGNFRVIDSLTNLGFSHSSRAPFFRKELEQFLLLSREQHLDPLKVMGSYAGAIGQPQFMPSSYRYYAVNFSKSGKIDLINNEVDVIGSIANYYKKHGWRTHAPVAMKTSLAGNHSHHSNLKAKMITLENRDSKEYWLGYHNFDVIKRYNASDLYAMAVFQLSHYIKESRDQLKHG
ncbi:MAG: lytic murein transglycosylase B [Gammaproteobacteria bacterium]|nr:lytic murein transglycosylase B [Gammaproteobacteria bacterium]